MIVEPAEKLPGSTSVACWLVELVQLSVLNFTSAPMVTAGTLAPQPPALLFVTELATELEPQPTAAAIAQKVAARITNDRRRNGTPLLNLRKAL